MDALPTRGFVFWPVGCGDSTTVAIDDETVLQIDLRHAESADSDDDPKIPVLDELLALLPRGPDGKPYLAAFGATHLDKDHITGFQELLDAVTIGDLWFTPRVLWEQDRDELCEDAEAFIDEAERRIKKLKSAGQVESGDRVRIMGFSDALEEHSDIYQNLPEGSVTVPGTAFTAIDGVDHDGAFRAFVHAPFKEDAEAERNHTSFALQVTLTGGGHDLRALLLGDLHHDGVRNIFERSDDDDLRWDLFLAPHHCSKSVLYTSGPDGGEPTLQTDLRDQIEEAAEESAYIISSSPPIPASDTDGANPPHLIAAKRYREMVDAGHFLCTGEHPNTEKPEPIVFEVSAEGVSLLGADAAAAARVSTLPAAVQTARGASTPPTTAVGFGRQ